jgi:uncharacterized cupin superfamily protein
MEVKKDTKIRVIRPSDVVWEEAAKGPEETEAPGDVFTAFTSPDAKFTTGYWQREVQRRDFVRPYHEIAYIIEGNVTLTLEDGEVIEAGPGDIVITPNGSKAHWHSTSRVRKFWAIYED